METPEKWECDGGGVKKWFLMPSRRMTSDLLLSSLTYYCHSETTTSVWEGLRTLLPFPVSSLRHLPRVLPLKDNHCMGMYVCV